MKLEVGRRAYSDLVNFGLLFLDMSLDGQGQDEGRVKGCPQRGHDQYSLAGVPQLVQEVDDDRQNHDAQSKAGRGQDRSIGWDRCSVLLFPFEIFSSAHPRNHLYGLYFSLLHEQHQPKQVIDKLLRSDFQIKISRRKKAQSLY